jgi:hypothetical protein
MMKYVYISNYSDLMRFTIFKCNSGYNMRGDDLDKVIALRFFVVWVAANSVSGRPCFIRW